MEFGKCPDVKLIGYEGASQGEYCGIPFLMNGQYIETCTKWYELADGTMTWKDKYWCPSPREVNSTKDYLWSKTGDTALCNEYGFPPDNGCEDHYEAVEDICVRVSPYPKKLKDAKAICEEEGSYLVFIPSKEIHDNLTALIQEKTVRYPYYSNVEYYWIGARPKEGSKDWEWLQNPMNMDEAFTNWKDNVKGFGCPDGQCYPADHAMAMKSAGLYNWVGEDKTKELGYICQGRCRKGYRWHRLLKKCVMIEYGPGKEKTVIGAMRRCHDSGGKLIKPKDCYNLGEIRQSARSWDEVPDGTDLFVGVLSKGLNKAVERKRSAVFDDLLDS